MGPPPVLRVQVRAALLQSTQRRHTPRTPAQCTPVVQRMEKRLCPGHLRLPCRMRTPATCAGCCMCASPTGLVQHTRFFSSFFGHRCQAGVPAWLHIPVLKCCVKCCTWAGRPSTHPASTRPLGTYMHRPCVFNQCMHRLVAPSTVQTSPVTTGWCAPAARHSSAGGNPPAQRILRPPSQRPLPTKASFSFRPCPVCVAIVLSRACAAAAPSFRVPRRPWRLLGRAPLCPPSQGAGGHAHGVGDVPAECVRVSCVVCVCVHSSRCKAGTSGDASSRLPAEQAGRRTASGTAPHNAPASPRCREAHAAHTHTRTHTCVAHNSPHHVTHLVVGAR
jgi:hypothetical protein